MRLLTIILALFGLIAAAPPAAEIQTSWRLLDYIAVDYDGAIEGGRVINQLEYDEMIEFGRAVEERLAKLPQGAARARLAADAARLRTLIAAKAPPPEIDRLARTMASALIAAFPIPRAPPGPPDAPRGAALYAQQCASCHGATGDAKTPLAVGMDPPPIAFDDRTRARERSVFALYQVIDQGLEGTAMASFGHLPAADKWALAFHAGRLAFPDVAEGKSIWESDPRIGQLVPDLASLAALTPSALGRDIGTARADAVTAYLRTEPAAVLAAGVVSLAPARARLAEGLSANRPADGARAETLALSAYLDGFEPVEPLLAARDSALMQEIERAMAEVRAAIGLGESAQQVAGRISALDALFGRAESALAPSQESAAASFLGAFSVLLREGLEALLIVIAMLAFLRKAERPAESRFVHGGWIAALVAGAATWWASANLIAVSGAGREMVEGVGALLAAIVLLFVGTWMHGKAQAGEWQRYIAERMGHAIGKGSVWFLFGLAFVAVYREVFETILFFAAMGAGGNQGALVAGAAVALLALAIIAFAMLRLSRRLPITQFFAWSAALIALLTVILAGKGVSALQEAGTIGITPLPSAPAIPILGIAPTAEALAAQAAMVVALLLGVAWNRRKTSGVGSPVPSS